MADSISGTYTFVDTCYSPELGIYVAVAKDLSSGTTPAQIYVSDNGSDWTLKKTLSQAKHFGNPNTRQVVVWWEKESLYLRRIIKFLFQMTVQLGANRQMKVWSVQIQRLQQTVRHWLLRQEEQSRFITALTTLRL